MQLYQAKKDRNEAESDRDTLSKMIHVKVVGLTKELGDHKLSESELIDMFDQTWTDWIEGMKLKPFKMPDIPNIVEKCITNFFPGHWKYIYTNYWDKELEIKIEEKHIKGKPNHLKFVLNLLMKPQIDPHILAQAQYHTDQTFFENKGSSKKNQDIWWKFLFSTCNRFAPNCTQKEKNRNK